MRRLKGRDRAITVGLKDIQLGHATVRNQDV